MNNALLKQSYCILESTITIRIVFLESNIINLSVDCFCHFLSSQKVTKKDLTAGTRSISSAGSEFAFA